jgi:hypothetical protein
MDKKEFRDIQKKILTLINHTKREDFKRGIDITSPEYLDALKTLKERLLKNVGLTMEEYNKTKESFKIPISWNELADRPHIPTLEEIGILLDERIRQIKFPSPQIINKTEIVKEIVKEKPTIIREKETVKEIDKDFLSTIQKDLFFLQEYNADLYPKIEGLREAMGSLIPQGFKEQWETLTKGGFADSMHSHRVRRTGIDGDTANKMIGKALTNYIIGDGIHKITVGSVEPVNPQIGDLWLQWSP